MVYEVVISTEVARRSGEIRWMLCLFDLRSIYSHSLNRFLHCGRNDLFPTVTQVVEMTRLPPINANWWQFTPGMILCRMGIVGNRNPA
jgi:hypothetical protein